MSLLRLSGRYIRRAVRSFDYDIIRYDSRSLSWWRTQVFRRNHIGLVIDVGANARTDRKTVAIRGILRSHQSHSSPLPPHSRSWSRRHALTRGGMQNGRHSDRRMAL